MSHREASQKFDGLSSLCKTLLRDGDSLLLRRDERDLEIIIEAGTIDESRCTDLYYALKYKLYPGDAVRFSMRHGEVFVSPESHQANEANEASEANEVSEVSEVSEASPPTVLAPASSRMHTPDAVPALPRLMPLAPPAESPQSSANAKIARGTEPQRWYEASEDSKLVMPAAMRGALVLYKKEHQKLAKRPLWPLFVIPGALWLLLPMDFTRIFLGAHLHKGFQNSWLETLIALALMVAMFLRRKQANDAVTWPLTDKLRRAWLPLVANGTLTQKRLEAWLSEEEEFQGKFPETASRFIASPLEQQAPDIYYELLVLGRAMGSYARYPWYIFAGPLLVALGFSHTSYYVQSIYLFVSTLIYPYFVVSGWLFGMYVCSTFRNKPKNKATLYAQSDLLVRTLNAFGMDRHSLINAMIHDPHLLDTQLPAAIYRFDPN